MKQITNTLFSTSSAVGLLTALAQTTRLDIFRRLVVAGTQGMPAGEIAAFVGCSATVLSFHLKEMRFAGLINAEQQGRFVIYRANFTAMTGLISYLTENCCARDGAVNTITALNQCCPTPSALSKPVNPKVSNALQKTAHSMPASAAATVAKRKAAAKPTTKGVRS